MKIGIVVDNELDNDHRVLKQINQLVNAKHDVFVICFDFGNNYKKYDTFSVTRISINQNFKNVLVLLSTRFSFYERLWAKNISNFITTNDLEAIHCHDLYLSKASKKGIETSNSTNLKLTLDLHENYPAAINTYNWATKGWRKLIVNPQKWYDLEFEYLNYADTIITLSDWFSSDLISRFPALKEKEFITHPNLLDLPSFKIFEKNKAEIKFSKKNITLIYFGVVAQRRGIMQIMPWLEKMLKDGFLFHLLIIGPVDKADSNHFNSLLKLPELSKNTTYIDWANIASLPAYLKQADIGLAPFEVNAQHNSGVANKLYQYMYGAIPILATACKAQKELIQESECGLIYSDFESFEKQLKNLLNNKELRSKLGKNGCTKLNQLYNSKTDEKFLDVYNG